MQNERLILAIRNRHPKIFDAVLGFAARLMAVDPDVQIARTPRAIWRPFNQRAANRSLRFLH